MSWLVTLGGCRLLDGLEVVKPLSFQEDCEEATIVLARGIVHASLEWRSETLVELRFGEVQVIDLT